MPVYQRSKIRFESSRLSQETGRCVTMAEFDCSPPPAGRETTFNYEREVAPMINPQYLQRGELRGLLAGAANAGETLDSATLLTDLAVNFNFKNFSIDEVNLPPDWRNGSRCFTVLLGYQVLYNVWEIRAIAAEQFTAGATTWPKDDVVATFRILVPDTYTFRRDYRWNPECCMGDRRIKDPDIAGPFPKRFYIGITVPPYWRLKPEWNLWPGVEYKYKDEEEEEEDD